VEPRKILFALGLLVGLQASIVLADTYTTYEELLADVEDETSYLEVLGILDVMLRHPVNLLTADRSEIAALPWISPAMAAEIVKLRQEGKLHSPDDLALIAGLSPRTIDLIRPFIVFEPAPRKPPPLSMTSVLRVGGKLPLENQQDLKTYWRARVSKANIKGGFLIEKDRGEKSLNDFGAYYIEVGSRSTKLIVGDFMLTSGHGLVFSGPFGYSPSFVSPWRYYSCSTRLKPYSSTDENLALRGVGLSSQLGRWKVSIVASHARVDARLDEDGRIVAFASSGYHVTKSEIESKDAVKEDLLGTVVEFGNQTVRAQASLSLTRYSHTFATSWSDRINGRTNFIGGVDFVVGTKNYLFGEFALTRANRKALQVGLLARGATTEGFVIARHYERGFFNRHANPFARYSTITEGESGLFTLLTFEPLTNVKLSLGNDVHTRDGSDGSEESGSQSFLKVRFASGNFTLAVDEKLTVVQAEARTQRFRSRVQFTHEPISGFKMSARYEHLRASETEVARFDSQSDLLRLDISIEGRRVGVKAGIYTFRIGDSNARIYEFEPGLPYYPTMQVLHSDGSRCYLRLSFATGKAGRIVLKIDRTAYVNQEPTTSFLFHCGLR